MTTIGIRQDERLAQPASTSNSMVQKILLACGVLSSLLYLATDIAGGLRYGGYSFWSQAISELAAVGAPSQAFVVPLFLAYGVLALAFGYGVFREAARTDRALRMTAALLIAYGGLGLTGFTLFPMQQRGVGSLESDLPHIVITAVIVVLLLLAMVFGAFALGRKFRVYSFATIFTILIFAALSALYAARLSAGQPTPGFGIVERVDVYSFLIWVGVFAVALLRSFDTSRKELPGNQTDSVSRGAK